MLATRKQRGWISPDKKAQVVTAYIALGNAALVEAVTGIKSGTIRSWKTMQWWKDLEAGIRDEENLQLDARLTKVVAKTFDLLDDRLEKGDFIYDSKIGQLIRKPVNADILNKINTDQFDRRQVLRNQRKETEVNNIQAGDFLTKLAQEFVKIAKTVKEPVIINQEKEIEDAEEIRAGT